MNRFKKAIVNERIALIFLLKLLILLCLVKSIFFFYNYKNNNGWELHSLSEGICIAGWSLYYDLVTISIISLPFFLAGLFPAKTALLKLVAVLAVCLGVLTFLLNIADIFYFSFHRQRADADLLYVIRDPRNYGSYSAIFTIAAILLFCIFFAWYLWRQYKKLIAVKASGVSYVICLGLIAGILASLVIGRSKKLIPSRPLTDVTAVQLPLTQNSFHTFLYSLYRSKELVIPSKMYMTNEQQNAFFSINKVNSNVSIKPKNIVLFVMESVPYEFFDSTSPYKPALPFLDSLLNHAAYYTNAFSYSYNSNKGITAILAGIPTITDIPLYHSGFSSMRKTSLGNLLAAKGYESSFFIGDNYDDFGFAKFCNWTGIQHYYCMENIEGYKNMEKHSMGLQDEFVLGFMQQKINSGKQPFFSTFYNISTHYPNDLTEVYKQKTARSKATAAMKSMMYYDDCLAEFFNESKKEKWYQNTVFIFCSDHWATPDPGVVTNDIVNSFRIPIIIFDPSVNTPARNNNMVSQLDIMNSILAYSNSVNAGSSFVSYGNALTDSNNNRVVFTKINNSVYQAINNKYIMGFNADEGKRLYCYDYYADPERKQNIPNRQNAAADSLELSIKAFLQTALLHYRNKVGP